MNDCTEHAMHEYKIRMLEEQVASDHEAIEEGMKLLAAHDLKLESALKNVEDLEGRISEAEREPALLLHSWKIAAIAAISSLFASVLVGGLAGR
ncbi:hypothetical protein [Eggerthella sinensis]|uniref:hypothetical protein n=1 Tax=Eggerthella sinensis TaxID=242230 RepID=UPI0022E14587|nr:hypothetical protein [Eggerthella sinensis]